jgi:hypothetical protein
MHSLHAGFARRSPPGSRDVAPRPASWQRLWPWLALAAILAVYAVDSLRLDPAGHFGWFGDDAVYFASAKALATGQGYILPSFPETLPANKYPELYPWLLSRVWRLDPDFPANVVPAAGMTLVFGCLFLIASFLYLRRELKLADGWALLAVAFCAFNFYVLLLTPSVMSDLPFAALALSAVLLAEPSLRGETRQLAALFAGVLAGLSVGMRALGLAVVAGIVALALVRRRFRPCALFCLGAVPLAAFWLWPAGHAALAMPAAQAGGSGHGWQQTLASYTSYARLWALSVPNFGTLVKIASTNLLIWLLLPGIYLLNPLAVHSAAWSIGLAALLSAACYAGVLRAIRADGGKALHAVFPFYSAIVLLWPFLPSRFLTLFLPLLFGGLCITTQRALAFIASGMSRGHSPARRARAVALATGMLALGATVFLNFAYAIPKSLAKSENERRALLVQKRQAYTWVRHNSHPTDRFIAYEDALLYLYTGRQAVRPIACLWTAYYTGNRRFAEQDAAHLADVARHIHPAYWVVSPDDFGLEPEPNSALLKTAETRLLEKQPLAFHTIDGAVRVYDVRCLFSPGSLGCQAPPGALPASFGGKP